MRIRTALLVALVAVATFALGYRIGTRYEAPFGDLRMSLSNPTITDEKDGRYKMVVTGGLAESLPAQWVSLTGVLVTPAHSDLGTDEPECGIAQCVPLCVALPNVAIDVKARAFARDVTDDDHWIRAEPDSLGQYKPLPRTRFVPMPLPSSKSMVCWQYRAWSRHSTQAQLQLFYNLPGEIPKDSK